MGVYTQLAELRPPNTAITIPYSNLPLNLPHVKGASTLETASTFSICKDNFSSVVSSFLRLQSSCYAMQNVLPDLMLYPTSVDHAPFNRFSRPCQDYQTSEPLPWPTPMGAPKGVGLTNCFDLRQAVSIWVTVPSSSQRLSFNCLDSGSSLQPS